MAVFVPTSWQDLPNQSTPITAAQLNRIEAGIVAAYIAGTGGLVNADIAAGAAIALTKLAATPYAAYTPTWTSSGAAPAIGNASVTARYTQIGKLTHVYGAIAFGSTSTFGSGAYLFLLPIVPASTSTVLGTAYVFDSSAGNSGAVPVLNGGSGRMLFEYGATYFGTDTLLGAAAPWTWAVGDQIQWNLTYEAA